MHVETLRRALAAAREKIEYATEQETDWRAERDRRRRQEAAFLRGIVRAEGSQRKAAAITGISQSTISRTLDPEGHLKRREDQAARRDATNLDVASPNNVIELRCARPERRRRPDWQPRELRRGELHKWLDQYYSWTTGAQKTARTIILNHPKELPDAAYYDDRNTDSDGSMGA